MSKNRWFIALGILVFFGLTLLLPYMHNPYWKDMESDQIIEVPQYGYECIAAIHFGVLLIMSAIPLFFQSRIVTNTISIFIGVITVLSYVLLLFAIGMSTPMPVKSSFGVGLMLAGLSIFMMIALTHWITNKQLKKASNEMRLEY